MTMLAHRLLSLSRHEEVTDPMLPVGRRYALAQLALKALLAGAGQNHSRLAHIDPQTVQPANDGLFTYLALRLRNGVEVHSEMLEARAVRALLADLPGLSEIEVGMPYLQWAAHHTAD